MDIIWYGHSSHSKINIVLNEKKIELDTYIILHVLPRKHLFNIFRTEWNSNVYSVINDTM